MGHAPRRFLVILAACGLAACGRGESHPEAEHPEEAPPTAEVQPEDSVEAAEDPVPPSGPRTLEAQRGRGRVSVTEGSGPLIDSNAPPPPPGQTVHPHPTLHGSCMGDIPACSEAGTVVRRATTLEQVRDGLVALGFEVRILP